MALRAYAFWLSEKLLEHDGRHDLHRLLGTILSMDMPASEKFGIMEQEYRIALDDRIREDVREMCNLSQGIMEKGIERGMAKGRAEGRAEGKAEGKAEGRAEAEAEMILNMHNAGFTIEQIVLATRKDEAEVRTVIEKGEPVLA